MNDYLIAYFVLVFSLLANCISKISKEKISGNITIPSLDFATPNLKEQYSDEWNIHKKSKYIEELLTSIEKKSKSVRHTWLSSKHYDKKESHQQVEHLFDEFKSILVTLHARKKSQDEELHLESGSKLSHMLHRFHRRKDSSEMNDNNQKPGKKM